VTLLCPKCGRETPATARFCIRCHATLRFTCPACKHAQTHGGTCDADFAKYAVVLDMQLAAAEAERKRYRNQATLVRQLVLLPVTGGLSLLKYFHDQMQKSG
jgi:zinc-ribbon domain